MRQFYYSPMKKKGATLAGIPRASGERNSPVGNGAVSHNQVSPVLFLQLHHPEDVSIAAAMINYPLTMLFRRYF